MARTPRTPLFIGELLTNLQRRSGPLVLPIAATSSMMPSSSHLQRRERISSLTSVALRRDLIVERSDHMGVTSVNCDAVPVADT